MADKDKNERPMREARVGFRMETELLEWVKAKAADRRCSDAQLIRDILYTLKGREEAGETFEISILGRGRPKWRARARARATAGR